MGYLVGFGKTKMVGEFGFETKLMHNPVGFFALGSSPFVENQRLLHSGQNRFSFENLPIFSGRLPVPGLRRPIRSRSGRILPVSLAEEVPFFLSHLRLLCTQQQNQILLHTNKKKKKEIIVINLLILFFSFFYIKF